MQKNVYLPNVELNMENVAVTQVLVSVGERVEAEQPILEVETQKATIEVPSSESGYVRELYVKAGDDVGEKALLCVLTDAPGEPFQDPRQTMTLPAERAETTTDAGSTQEQEISTTNIVPAAPAARKLARDLGVDLNSVNGTGPNGRVTVEDVQAAAKPAPATDATDWTPLPASRVALNAQMQKSLAEIPQIHIARQMDVTPLVRKSEGITFTHRLILAAATALKQHPALRTIIEGDKIKTEPVSVAVAMDTTHGLVAPAIRSADNLSLERIAVMLKEMQGRAEANSLKREEMLNAPFAITNLGMLGVDFFQAFVFHGQTAVLAVGRAVDAAGGRKVAWFNLAVDHRIVDGAEAARFLESLQQEILKS